MFNDNTDKYYYAKGYDGFPFVDDLSLKIEKGVLTSGKSVASDWLEQMTDLELALLLKMLDKIRDDIHDSDDASEIVLMVARLYYMETGSGDRFIMTEEYLYECVALFHLAACFEGMKRNRWVEYEPIGITTTKEIIVRTTELGKKMLGSIVDKKLGSKDSKKYTGLSSGLKNYFEENSDKW